MAPYKTLFLLPFIYLFVRFRFPTTVMQKSHCNAIFSNKGNSLVLRKQRNKCEALYPKYFSTISPPKNRGLGTGLGNINRATGKLILHYVQKHEAVHSRGDKKGKLKKGYRYVGNGYIIKI
jgi:hypothetical protein